MLGYTTLTKAKRRLIDDMIDEETTNEKRKETKELKEEEKEKVCEHLFDSSAVRHLDYLMTHVQRLYYFQFSPFDSSLDFDHTSKQLEMIVTCDPEYMPLKDKEAHAYKIVVYRFAGLLKKGAHLWGRKDALHKRIYEFSTVQIDWNSEAHKDQTECLYVCIHIDFLPCYSLDKLLATKSLKQRVPLDVDLLQFNVEELERVFAKPLHELFSLNKKEYKHIDIASLMTQLPSLYENDKKRGRISIEQWNKKPLILKHDDKEDELRRFLYKPHRGCLLSTEERYRQPTLHLLILQDPFSSSASSSSSSSSSFSTATLSALSFAPTSSLTVPEKQANCMLIRSIDSWDGDEMQFHTTVYDNFNLLWNALSNTDKCILLKHNLQ